MSLVVMKHFKFKRNRLQNFKARKRKKRTSIKKDYLNFYKLHVVITGGSSGIGYDLCKQAFEKGANISIIARNKVITFNFMLSLFYRYLKLILFLFEPG